MGVRVSKSPVAVDDAAPASLRDANPTVATAPIVLLSAKGDEIMPPEAVGAAPAPVACNQSPDTLLPSTATGTLSGTAAVAAAPLNFAPIYAAQNFDAPITTARLAGDLPGDAEQFRQEATLRRCIGLCSRITDGLFLCGHEVAEKLVLLKACGVTCVVNFAAEVFPCPFVDAGMSYLAISVSDAPDQDITSLFHSVVEVIEAVKRSGGAVALHCQYGVSRSASFAIAYVMWATGVSFQAALATVQAQRGCVNPNPGFVAQLLEWEKYLSSVRGAGHLPTPVLLYRTAASPATCWMSSHLAAAVSGEVVVPSSFASDAAVHMPWQLKLARGLDFHTPAVPAIATLTSPLDEAVFVLRVTSSQTVSTEACLAFLRDLPDAKEVCVILARPTSPVAAVTAAVQEVTRWQRFRSCPALPSSSAVPSPSVSIPSVPVFLRALGVGDGGSDCDSLPGELSIITTGPIVVAKLLLQPVASPVPAPAPAIALPKLPFASSKAMLRSTTSADESSVEASSRPLSGATQCSKLSLPTLGGGEDGMSLAAPRRSDETGTAHDGSELGSPKPRLFRWEGNDSVDSEGEDDDAGGGDEDKDNCWDDLGVFEADDLESDGLFALIHVAAVDHVDAFAWVGEDFHTTKDGDDRTHFITSLVATLAARTAARAFPSHCIAPATVQVVLQNHEPEAFWDVFDC